MAIRIVLSGIFIAFMGIAPALAQASIKHNIEIPSEELGAALETLAKQTHIQVVYSTQLVEGHSSQALSGSMTPEDALRQLLKPTGLTFEFLDPQTVTLVSRSGVGNISDGDKGNSNEGTEGKSSWDRFRLAQVDQGGNSNSSVKSPSASDRDRDVRLKEVIVTAQRREERLIDTPQSVTALNTDELAQKGVTQLRDFADTVPGLTINTKGAGSTQVTLRGVSGGLDVSTTTAMYVDDVPFGSSTAFGGSATNTLDLAPFDLERIEVLRGPQGTLYGVSSMGGLIKYVTRKPDLNNFGGNAQAGSAYTNDGGIGYNVAAAVNLPIVANKLALRASGFESRDGGYIDNIALNRKDVNRSDTHGGRLDVLFEPTSTLSVRVSGVLQDILQDGGELPITAPPANRSMAAWTRTVSSPSRSINASAWLAQRFATTWDLRPSPQFRPIRRSGWAFALIRPHCMGRFSAISSA